MATPDTAVRDYLNTNVAALTTGANLFAGKARPADAYVPKEAVFCLDSGSPPAEILAGPSNPELAPKRVRLTVRSGSGDFEGGQTLARSVVSALHGASITGYVRLSASCAGPLYVRQNEDNTHEWLIVVTLLIME
jgi:hypothetical protein